MSGHVYNWHWRHHGINIVAPLSRLSMFRKNLLALYNQAALPPNWLVFVFKKLWQAWV